ncbi:L-rhamnose 1-epimerase [Frankia sp. R43]|nr:L-rhamnose mutarotase [Frankia sp. R43]KPM50983.1 L-rhamnose 1-epimerase [Frankia sp. R43]
MRRYCFCLQVKPERTAEYTRRHSAVWPEMRAALSAAGWHNYSLFLRPDGLLIGYVETDDLALARARMAASEVNARWQAEMADFFVELGTDMPDEAMQLVPEVFHLDSTNPLDTPEAPETFDAPDSTARLISLTQGKC